MLTFRSNTNLWSLVVAFAVLTACLTAACGGEKTEPAVDGDEDGDGDADIDETDPDPVTEPTKLLLGYGEADVSPPLGTVLGGFGAPGGVRKITAIHDPLLAQAALFVNDAGEAFLLISLDSAGYFFEFGDWGPGVRELRRTIAERLADKVTLLPEHILVASSHSHAATDLVGFWQRVKEGVPKDLLGWHVEKITEAAAAAADKLEQVELYYGETELVGYSGRDRQCSEIIDNSVSVLQARYAGGDAPVTIVDYAKHPTVLGERNVEASADWVWGLRDVLGAQTGGPVMYLQGFVAAVHDGPKMSEIEGADDFERAYETGRVVAEAAGSILDDLTKGETYAIRHQWGHYESPGDGEYLVTVYGLFEMPKRAITTDGTGRFWVKTLEVSWHLLGPAEFAVFPGEGTPEYSLALKERMVSPAHFVVGLGNDCIGYLIDPESAAADTSGQLAGYELKMGLGPEGGPRTWTAMESLGWFDGGWRGED
ncbi:MAG: hypothetical protein C4523_19445 [Myxococcales bacterium]|nr:MAG: hypothetical protein C4523_19445 [Myxococcales bacterium]